ncbi:IGR protein motif-domain-containing protein [Powellomyces hirtus]|nr:IGR protein motif-domain-containing protein [Powellomyces hirtus]
MVCTYFLQRLRQSAATLIKTKSMTASVENWGLTQQYIELSPKEKIALIPSSRGPISDPKSFLTAIGRGCESYADKFKSWDHLFTATAHEMETDLGVKCAQRKYILGWRDWFKRGIEPYEVKIARRQKKYLKEKAKVQLARLKRQGLA